MTFPNTSAIDEYQNPAEQAMTVEDYALAKHNWRNKRKWMHNSLAQQHGQPSHKRPPVLC
jgi:hypothetical protein